MIHKTVADRNYSLYEENIRMSTVRKPDSNICIINDSEIIREGLFSLLRRVPHLEYIGAFNGQEIPGIKKSWNFELILTDIEFDGKIDIEPVRNLREKFPNARIIIYTNFKNHEFRNIALNSGADFFLFMEDKYNLLEHLITGIVSQQRFKRMK